jgi:RNA polymerase sigma factor (sigma-70 family)
MMQAVAIPPFERFYGEHCDEVLGYLRRVLGPRAEDAWQETFLRALRAYDRLEHGRHLRAWVFTIATRVAMDDLRRSKRDVALVDELPDSANGEPARAAYQELEHLTGELPPTERAAVVLRYGYDLPYAEIGSALGSSEEAARAAASSGVRRLRARFEMKQMPPGHAERRDPASPVAPIAPLSKLPASLTRTTQRTRSAERHPETNPEEES